jgi:hypothetical protein
VTSPHYPDHPGLVPVGQGSGVAEAGTANAPAGAAGAPSGACVVVLRQ